MICVLYDHITMHGPCLRIWRRFSEMLLWHIIQIGLTFHSFVPPYLSGLVTSCSFPHYSVSDVFLDLLFVSVSCPNFLALSSRWLLTVSWLDALTMNCNILQEELQDLWPRTWLFHLMVLRDIMYNWALQSYLTSCDFSSTMLTHTWGWSIQLNSLHIWISVILSLISGSEILYHLS